MSDRQPGWRPRAAEEDDARWKWLGGPAFWAAFGGVVLGLLLLLGAQRGRLFESDVLVPVVSLSGPTQARPGDKLRYAVLVRDRFGGAVKDADVRVGFMKYGLTELARGRTGEGGEVELEVTFPADFAERRILGAIAAAGQGRDEAGIEVSPRAPKKESLYVSTDKPLYQPGQTIHVRALAMADDKPIADRATTFEVRTDDGIKVFRVEKPTSAFGVVAADFVLAEQVKLGTYTIAVKADKGPSGARAVEVKRYALPKLKLAIDEAGPFAPDGVLRGKARAAWIFGEPVTKANVTVTLEQGGKALRQQTGEVDKDGVFRFALAPGATVKPADQPQGTFTLRARIDLEAGLRAEASTTVSTLGAEMKLEAFPESGAFVAGVTQKAFVVVTHAQREGVEVQAMADGPVARTNAQGVAVVTIPGGDPKANGIDLRATAPDGSKGRLIAAAQKARLVIQPDKTAYAAGESARLKVVGGDAGDRIALRLTKAAEPIAHGSCVVAGAGPTRGCELAIPLPKDVSGLVWIHALSMPRAKGEVLSGKRLVLLAGGARDLDLAVVPSQPVFRPGEKGEIDVTVTGAGGAPVKAQLGVAVADEAVFALADVRPDLEKRFFTVDRDLAEAAAPASDRRTSEERARTVPVPAPFDAYAAYERAASEEVRGVVLAALSTMPEPGAVETDTSSAVAERAQGVIEDAQRRIGAWVTILFAVASVLAFAGFAVYAFARLRFAAPLAADATAVRLETRGLAVDWLVAVIGPPVLAVLSLPASSLFSDGTRSESAQLVGTWTVVGGLGLALLVRGVLRLRRTVAEHGMSSLRRVLSFLPVAVFFGHFANLLVLADQGRRMRALVDVRENWLVLPLFVALAAQLAFGVLSLTRQTLLRPVTRRGRIWLVASRASFLGLPVTIVCAVLLVRNHAIRARESWDEFFNGGITEEEGRSSDNKEGGTGTRAKGEEGSMGNAKRYGAQGPADNPQVHVRDHFPETLLWAPDVVTDDAGRARITVPFADSITTWRFGLRAVGRAGQLGSTTVPLVVTQDFFVDAALPPVLTQGDEIAVPVTVYGYTKQEQEVTVAIAGDGFAPIGFPRAIVRLAPGETRGIRFVLRADKAGERLVRISASSPARADAEERKVIVVPNGLHVVRTTNGHMTGERTIAAELPAGAIEGGNDLYLKVYGGPLSQVSEGLDGVFAMPHGCFEQSSSTTYPSILALDFLERTKAASSELDRKARGYIAQGYQQIVSFEVAGGGFSLFGKSPASVQLTAYGLLELADLERVSPGLVDETVVARARAFLLGKRSVAGGWAKTTWDGRPGPDDVRATAYVAWALAAGAAKTPDPRIVAVLDAVAHARSEPDDPYLLALRANALLAGGRDARPVLEELARLAARQEDGVRWSSKGEGVLHSAGESFDVETTGLAAHALARGDAHPDLRAGALDWLVARRGRSGTWSTTQATIAAMRALLDEARPAPKETQDITVLADGAAVESWKLEVAHRDVHRLVSLRKWATTGKHAISVRATGSADVSYQLVAGHYERAPAPPRSTLELAVAYPAKGVPSGSTAPCRVRVGWRGKEPATMPLVEIAIPPSFEPETADLDALLAKPDSLLQRYGVERGKVTLYLATLSEDKPLAFDLRLRALRPARVLAPASVAYLYYEPEVRVATAPALVQAL